MGNANADPSSDGTSTALGTLTIPNTVTKKMTKLKALPHGVDTSSSGLGNSANDVSGLDEGGSIKIGPPSRKKQKKLDHNSTDDAEMHIDMSRAKIGPPSRKKRKKQSCTSADRTDEMASSTNNSHVTLSPASTKRLADFDRDVLVLDSDNFSACKVNGSQVEKDIGPALGINGEEGEAIKTVH